MSTVLVDSGFWYAMFDGRDQYHQDALDRGEFFELLNVVVPWPILYETLRTRFVRNTLALEKFERYLKNPRIVFIEDEDLRNDAYELSLESSLRRNRSLSMVDCLIRLMLADVNIRVDWLATFNDSDFLDVCAPNGVEII